MVITDPIENADRWLSRQQLATMLSIHENTVYRYMKERGFPQPSRALGSPRWSEREVQEFMEAGLERPAGLAPGGS